MVIVGMDEDEDLFVFVVKSVCSCVLWLGINLFIVFLVFWFIGLFEVML